MGFIGSSAYSLFFTNAGRRATATELLLFVITFYIHGNEFSSGDVMLKRPAASP